MQKKMNHTPSSSSIHKNIFMAQLSAEINEPVMLIMNDDFIIQDINISAAKAFFGKEKNYFVNRSLFDILIEHGFYVQKIKDSLSKKNKSSFHFAQLEKLVRNKKKYIMSITTVVIDKKAIYAVSIMTNNSYDVFNSYMNAIINNLPGSVYWKDLNGHYLGCNKFVATMAGYDSPEHIIGKTDYDLCWKEFADEWRLLDQTVMTEDKTIIREEFAKLADGRIITELTHKSALKNEDNKIIGIIGTSLDITERKKMEKELIKAKEKAEKAVAAKINAESAALLSNIKAENEEEMRKTVMVLVGDIVHDLRTPIATIRTAGNLLSNILPDLIEAAEEGKKLGATKIDALNQKKLAVIADRTLLQSLHNAVTMMDDFINTTLKELANAQKAHLGELTHADLNRCSSRRILENTLDAYPASKGVKINQNISYDFYLMGNSILIMRILFNLLKNAADQITINGLGEIFISTKDGGNFNLITVKDTAGGAPPAVVDKLFSGYFTTKKNGTGIGLSFCKKTMENFGGDLTCQNVYGQYIEFVLSFPKIKNS